MSRDESILEEIGSVLGLTLNFDEEGQCLLLFDQELFVSLSIWNDNTWFLSGVLLDSLPVEMGESFWRKVMMLNCGVARDNIGNIVYSDDDNVLLLMDTITELSNVHAIIAHLERFVNRLEVLINEFR
ncbi:CesT family type III secretion system chaperone [Salmonella enterica]|nr:chaperone SicP [Salmonella enterica subsp. enterica serovar Freetown]EBN9932865.1 chaperone SicP [Salmonella enterica]EDV9774760.1 chaperone SicP [Salmonella enterica subsp. enterica serovar Poona]EBH8792745.1 chaperone SicP [Salmonella enterica subsp. enterica serovar Freetown]EBP0843366.1 chaperone SicP [Salmonella enterica]